MHIATIERPTRPPSKTLTKQEWTAIKEPLRLVRANRALRNAPRGAGRLTIDLPGYLAPEIAMSPIRSYLRWLGHDAQSWGLGTNQGDPEALRFAFIAVLEARVAEHGAPANLVAWSLGGVVAREVARLRPDLVHRVVCFGSPLIGGPKYTAGSRNVPQEELDRIEALQQEFDEQDPVQVPVTSIFSKRDGIVSWQASIDHYSPDATHVEVRSTHLGLGVDPDVWLAVAEALAE